MESNKPTNKKPFVYGAGFSIFAVVLALGIMPILATDSVDANLFGIGVGSDDTILQGHYTFTHRDGEGNVLQTFQSDNLVVNEGMECVADFVFGTTSCVAEAVFQYLAVGTGAVATVDGDTALGSESGTCARVQDATPVINTAVTGERKVTISSIFSGASCEGEAYAETGLFDAGSSGNLLARTLISPAITLGTSDTLTVDYTITINNT